MVLTPLFVFTLLLNGIFFKYLACVIFLIASLTDLYDGYIARRYGSVSKWGKFLDPLADKILILSALVCLAILDYITAWMVVVIGIRDIVITGLRSYAFFKGKPVVTINLAQWKTASQALVVYLILLYMVADVTLRENNISWVGIAWIQRIGFFDFLVFIVTILTVYTGAIYLYNNRDHIKGLVIDVKNAINPKDTTS